MHIQVEDMKIKKRKIEEICYFRIYLPLIRFFQIDDQGSRIFTEMSSIISVTLTAPVRNAVLPSDSMVIFS